MTILFSKTIDFDQPFQRLRLRSFWTISTENQWEITEIGRFSLFPTPFDHFHFHPTFQIQMITLAETASYACTGSNFVQLAESC